MNAVEFVKNQINEFGLDAGWEKTKAHLDYLISYGSEFGHVSKQEVEDLKRLVESYEFINKHGGIDRCKDWYRSSPFKRDKYMRELNQAIADVESVGGGV